jgi:hypothetical protein
MTKRINKLSNKRKESNGCIKITTILAVRKARRCKEPGSGKSKQVDSSSRKCLSVYDINNFIVQPSSAKIGRVEQRRVLVPTYRELEEGYYDENISEDVYIFYLE